MTSMTLEKLAEMTMNGFRESESKFMAEIDRLDKKIEYRFDALSNRIDDLALGRATRYEHHALEKRVSKIERKIGLV